VFIKGEEADQAMLFLAKVMAVCSFPVIAVPAGRSQCEPWLD
jgi:hypothetical protein